MSPVDHVLCFSGCVCKQCHLPALIFYIALDEKQNIKLLWPYGLAGQPLHKREEEGSGVMPIHELFQRLAVTRCVQNRTREDIAPGWSERMVGTVPTYYWTRRSGTWLVSSYVCWWRGAIWLGCTPGCSRYNSRTGMAPDLSSSLLWRGWPARLVQHIDLLLSLVL